MKTHPWDPIIFKSTRKLIVGTLPPKSAKFYFSNSINTRLWDLLYSTLNNLDYVVKGSNELSDQQKRDILEKSNLGITDIIYGYERDIGKEDSWLDKHINPKEYRKILELIEETQINEILFVYKNAAKWFLHSLNNDPPKKVSRLKFIIEDGIFGKRKIGKRKVKFTLLPSPLNRARKKGETLRHRLEAYKKYCRF